MNHNLKIVFLILGTILFSQSFTVEAAEAPSEEWSLSMGIAGKTTSDNDHFSYAQQASDGGYIVSGTTSSYGKGTDGYPDAWLVKLDKNGNLQWNKTYGGTYSDWGFFVKQTSDNGYALTGLTFPSGFGEPWLVKTDSNGNEMWDKVSDNISQDDYLEYVAERTDDGGYIVPGTVEYEMPDDEKFLLMIDMDILLTKYDSNGTVSWNNTYGKKVKSELIDFDSRPVRQALDNGYVIAGSTIVDSTNSYDIWLIKTDEYGNEQWNKTYGGSMDDSAFCISLTSDNGYVIAGMYNDSWGFSVDGSAFILKTDNEGNQQWIREFSNCTLYSVEQTSDNGYIAAGTKDGRAWVVKLEGDKAVNENEGIFHKLLNYIYGFFK